MEKSKDYASIKFPYETIDSALSVFTSFLDAKSKKSLAGNWQVTINDEIWGLDNKDQFIVEYQKSEARAAHLFYCDQDNNNLFSISIRSGSPISTLNITSVKISLPNRENIERVFSVFESSYEKLLSEKLSSERLSSETKNNEDAENISFSRYSSIEVTLPSTFLDKKTLVGIEHYLIQRVSKLIPIKKGEGAFFYITIVDSLGTASLHSLNEFPYDLFDNDTESIRFVYGSQYLDDLSIILMFSKKKDNSKLTVSYKGENARDIVESLINGVIKQLKDAKTLNFIYHPNFGIQALLFLIAAMLAYFQVGILIKYHQWVWSFTSLLLFIIIYFNAPFLKPYSTFETKRNNSVRRWDRWLIETILGGLLLWLITLLLLSKIKL